MCDLHIRFRLRQARFFQQATTSPAWHRDIGCHPSRYAQALQQFLPRQHRPLSYRGSANRQEHQDAGILRIARPTNARQNRGILGGIQQLEQRLYPCPFSGIALQFSIQSAIRDNPSPEHNWHFSQALIVTG